MSLITAAWVEEKFPLWNKYFLDENSDPSETVLTDEIANAETEYSQYVAVDEDEPTDLQKLQLLIIVKKRGFDRRHGDEEFESRPQILKDYDNLIKQLKEELSDSDSITMNTKTRRFGSWFNETTDYNSTTGL
jgi:hypothetical protein